MAYSIHASDQLHFSTVQQLLASDGLHVAMTSTHRGRLDIYASELARALALNYGLRVESYQASRLESIVVDLMLQGFDDAFSRISGPGVSRINRPSISSDHPGSVLFIPDAQSMALQELTQLMRIASGTRQLRLVALFDKNYPFECEARLRVMGDQLANWDLDTEDVPVPTRRTMRVPVFSPPVTRMLPASTALLALLLSLLTAFPVGSDEAVAISEAHIEWLRGSAQLAGEPPADFRRSGADVQENLGQEANDAAAGARGDR